MAGPGSKPTLIIPMKFDAAEALKMLDKLREGGEDAGEALKGAGGKAKSLGENVATLISHQGYQMLKDGAAALAQGYKETADYIKTISSEYINLRETLQQVAALKGQQNTGDFTVKQARAAEGASLKPEEWVKFQESFQSYAGAYIEGDQRKMNDGQAEDYQKRLAQFAKARGISADQAGQLGGGILQFANGPIDTNQAMAQFGRAFKTLERATTPVPQLLPQMSRIMSRGASSDEAAQLLNLASGINPGEEGTTVDATLRAINKTIRKGKGDELGVTNAMSPLQKVRAASQKLNDRIAAGEDEDKVLSQYFNDPREMRGGAGFINVGIRNRGFDLAAGYVKDTPDDFTQSAIADYEKSDQGKFARQTAGLATARIERGDKYKEVELAKVEAEKQLTKEGRFEENGWEDMIRNGVANIPLAGFADRQTQLINQRAAQNAQRRAAASGAISGNEDFLYDAKDAIGSNLTERGANDTILNLLKKRNELAERQANKPLAAKPADPVVRPR